MNPVPIPPGMETRLFLLENDALNQLPEAIRSLWGNDARSKKDLIDQSRHLVLEAAHPSPLSAHRGFFGCRHFSQANAFLQENGREPVQW